MLTQAGLFFSTEPVTTFCDGRKHHKKVKDRLNEEWINDALLVMGITPVQVSGCQIRDELKSISQQGRRSFLREAKI